MSEAAQNNDLLVRAVQGRAYPNQAQRASLGAQLRFARNLWNSALEQRRWLWSSYRASINYHDQSRELTELRHDPECDELWPAGMNTWTQQEVLRRLDRAYQRFYAAARSGRAGRGLGKTGPPRYKGHDRFSTLAWSFTGKAGGCKLLPAPERSDGSHNGRQMRLHLQGIGALRVKWSRDVQALLDAGAIPRQLLVTVKSSGHVELSLQFQLTPAARTLLKKDLASFGRSSRYRRPTAERPGRSVGIDLGINKFIATSDGELVQGPRALRSALSELAEAQQRCSTKKRGSNRRRKAARQVARKHARVANARRDFHHKLARELVTRYDSIFIEDLNIKGLAKSALALDVNDAAWGLFIQTLESKAVEAGSRVERVAPHHTSQTCSSCQTRLSANLTLSDRSFYCESEDCGLVIDRDLNAALNIQRLGLSQRHRARRKTVQSSA